MMVDNYQAGLDSLDTLVDGPQTAALGDRLKVVRDVLKGLLSDGTATPKNIWTWIPIILQLIQTLGPVVQEIIDAIKKAIGKGQTAETFTI